MKPNSKKKYSLSYPPSVVVNGMLYAYEKTTEMVFNVFNSYPTSTFIELFNRSISSDPNSIVVVRFHDN